EAEQFADEDKAVKERIEAKNSLENYLYTLKNQLADELGKKLDEDDKKTISDIVKEKLDWLDANGASATKEDLDEQKTEVEAVVNPITQKLYGSGGGSSGEDDESPSHGENQLGDAGVSVAQTNLN
ncbi:ATPase with role in protein import into the ER, partial [Gonapodya sp. JEL0774]